jgi:hypothetical protein
MSDSGRGYPNPATTRLKNRITEILSVLSEAEHRQGAFSKL